MEKTKRKRNKAGSVRSRFKVLYHAVDRKKNEVELILKEEHVSNVLEVQRESDGSLKLKMEGLMSVYMPHRLDIN